MHKLAGLLAALWITPTAAVAMPHVELALRYRPVIGAPNNVRLSATNFGPGYAYVMSYHTAFALPEGRTTGKWLQVRDQAGNEVAYKGRWVLTRTPGPSSYRSIAPGETITSDIDLAAEYRLPDAGSISVNSAIDIMDRIQGLDDMGKPENVPHELVESASVQFSVRTTPSASRAGVSSVIQCSAEQTDSTQQAIVGAQAASYEALMFLGSCPVNFLDPVNGGVISQVGTIAHEVSHRPDGYALPTQDFPNVKNRATAHALDRTSAVRSGANFEYFIMDVPLGRDGLE